MNQILNYINQILESEVLQYTVLGNSLKQYLIALGVFILSMIILKIFKYSVLHNLKKLAKKTKVEIDDILIISIQAIHWPLYFFISIYIAIQFLSLPEIIGKGVSILILIAVAYYAVKAVQRLVDFGFQKVANKKRADEKNFDPSIINLSKKFTKGVLWILAGVIILQNLGYNISALVAGLGIGGLAIAFALQSILSDIFSSFSIYFDKPFEIGDFIIVGKDMGVVTKIGIKSTRIQALQGEEIVISNQELTSTRVNNYKKMDKRRVQFSLGVTYNTKLDKVKKIPKLIEEAINKTGKTEFDRAHFKSFGDFSLNFEVVYYLKSNDYNEYMDAQQEINLAIKESFEKENIEFAYPTQTIFVEK